MRSPFPGMDPYLEAPDLWPDVHHSLAVALRAQLTPRLSPRYVAFVEHGIVVESFASDARRIGADLAVTPAARPARAMTRRAADTRSAVTLEPAPIQIPVPSRHEVKHFWIEIREANTKPSRRRLVTVIEILSRANKLPGKDRVAYEKKSRDYLASRVSFVELDLLRAGRRWKVGPDEATSDYRLLMSRASRREPRVAEIWPVGIREALPAIPLPLDASDPDVPLDVQAALTRVYEDARYDLTVDYRGEPPPPDFSDKDARWIRGRVARRPR